MQTLIFHMHGLGDMIMFLPTFNALPNKKKSIDIIVFENSSVLPLITSKKIRKIYYCNSSYLNLFKNILILFFKNFERVYFSHNFSPLKSILISLFLNSKKIYIVTEKKIFFKSKKIEIIKIKKKLHKVYRNLSLINKNIKKIKFDNSLHYKKIKNIKNWKKDTINIGIHPGSNIKNGDKRWEIKKYIELINLLKKSKIQIHIFIGEYENELFNYFNKKLNGVNIVYKKSFNYITNLISRLNLFISNETGLAHLSSSLGIKTFVIIHKKNERRKTEISLPFRNSIFIDSTEDKKDLNKIFKLLKKNYTFFK